MTVLHKSVPLILLTFLISFNISNSEPFLGVNYGQVADNLPAPSDTAKLLQSTSIEKIRLYGADPAIIKALANTGKGIVIGTANGDIPALATDPNFAKKWVDSNVLAFYPASNIILINVGNEVLLYGDQNMKTQLLPAMQNIKTALDAASVGDKIKVSTVHPMTVLKQSEPPSAGSFDPALTDILKGMLEFNNATGSPFAVNPYPYFAYRDDPRPETLSFCLFQTNPGRMDGNTKINYMNMFDAQVDAVRAALNAMAFKDVEIVVAETGWPYKGDANEVGPSIENAKAYNGNLIAHLRSKVGTPLMPGKSVDTYFFALYDEDLKPGPTSERSFGLFKTDLTMSYDAGLSKSSQTPAAAAPNTPANAPNTPTTTTTPARSPTNAPLNGTPATPAQGPTKSAYCVPKKDASDAQLQANIDYACGQDIDCSPIKPGGACYEPNNLAEHAKYAMNLYYQKTGQNPTACDFSKTAELSSTDPIVYTLIFQAIVLALSLV